MTARHALQAMWKVGYVGRKHQELLVAALEKRFSECVTHKNCTLIRYDIIESLRKLFDAVQDETIRTCAEALIELECDPKFKKKYSLSGRRSEPRANGDDMAKAQKLHDIDGYIAQFPADVQAILEQVRQTISHAAPEAKETISYQMPAFRQHGILVYFAAWKKHIGLYPPISGDKALERAAARYAGPKGNLQFPLDEPIPYDLIERIVKLRGKQALAKAAAKRKKRK